MNLKAWLKGLCVFVFSSVVTALLATNLSPTTFNFSQEGFAKLGVLVLVIASKAVLLYLQKSPLRFDSSSDSGSAPQPPAARPPLGGLTACFALLLVLPLMLATSGCVNSWEQTTYATLAASKSVIDCAIAGYNGSDPDILSYCSPDPRDPNFNPAPFHIQRTREAQQAIEEARQVQTAAVRTFEVYAVAKVAHDPKVSLAEKESAVISQLTQLAPLISSIRGLFAGPAVRPAAALRQPEEFKRNVTNAQSCVISIAGCIEILNPALEVSHGN
ncbi:MAG TPA: hypothetical protein VFK06_08785 [Candidatus Angelobacter sp.]|nr:hypothetical protein [Candidatus Angelobacter sp.]